MVAERKITPPQTNPETQAFWEAAAQGTFLIRRCGDCGKAHWYPRANCPFCYSGNTRWEAGSGRGTIYSFSIMRRVPEPYAIAYVTLEEGPSMMTNIVDCDLESIHINQKVSIVFKPTEGGPPIPAFAPIA